MVGRALGLLVVLMTVVSLSSLLLGRTAASPAFTRYLADDSPYLPGQLAPPDCASRGAAYSAFPDEICTLAVADGFIDTLQLTIRAGVVHNVYVEPDALTLADLVGVFGEPDRLQVHPSGYGVCWGERAHAVALKAGTVALRSPVIFLNLSGYDC